MPETIQDWNGRPIQVVRSKGGVLAVCDFADNLIRCDGMPWPPPPVVQKLYESRQSRAFVDDELAAVTKRLGFYSSSPSTARTRSPGATSAASSQRTQFVVHGC